MSYLAHTEEDRRAMLDAIGLASLDELFAPIPADLRIQGLDLPAGLSELETRSAVEELASRNRIYGSLSFLGAGAYSHFVPAAVRALITRAEFLTSYTPYQAEVSQGTLQSTFEFQTAICELTGLDVANASLYDGPSALAEATFLAMRETRHERALVSAGVHPEAREVLSTYASGPGIALADVELDRETGRTRLPPPDALAGAGALVVQQPNFFGVIEDLVPFAAAAHDAGALLVVMQNPMTLGVLASPGSVGADVAVGDVQVFGNGLSLGGPYAGYLACREQFVRQLPGRLVGQTTDLDGRTGFALTLQAREQHIRRAKATSNVCTNQALNALAATIYLSLAGPRGLRQIGEVCVKRAHYLQAGLTSLPGIEAASTGPFFNEFALRLPGDSAAFAAEMRPRGVDPGVPLGRFDPAWYDLLLVAVTEVNSPTDLETYLGAAAEVLGTGPLEAGHA